MNKVASGYFKYLRENPKSFLARIYGVYKVQMAGGSPVYLMLMAHTLKTENSGKVERVFDLKGSWVNRHVKVDPR